MDTALQHHKYSRGVIPHATSSSSTTANHRPLLAQNARIHDGFAMPALTDLCITRVITAKPIRLNHHHHHHHHHQKLFCVNTNKVTLENNLTMANEEANKKSQLLNVGKQKMEEKEVERSTPSVLPPPPPPEKPLPGDCCGSGCVRCVWDVYFEELEAYNKLHGNSNSD